MQIKQLYDSKQRMKKNDIFEMDERRRSYCLMKKHKSRSLALKLNTIDNYSRRQSVIDQNGISTNAGSVQQTQEDKTTVGSRRVREISFH